MKALEQLCKLNIISGFEKNSVTQLKGIFESYGLKTSVDKFGNVIGKKGNPNSDFKILIDAHIDEIGLIVKDIKDGGFVEFDTVGGIDLSNLFCQEVLILSGDKKIYGVIGAIPPHLENTKCKDSMLIDTGLKNAKEIIHIGDPIKLKTKYLPLKNNCFSSGAIDNRGGLLCGLLAAKKMSDDTYVTVVGSVREETGLKGIEVFLLKNHFDLAIVLDVTHGYFSGLKKHQAYPVGEGFTICYGGILDNMLTKLIEEFLIENNIKYNVEFEADNPGTNAYNIITHNIPVIMLSLPLKYMHTTCEVISSKDLKNLSKLIRQFDWKGAKTIC